MELVKVKNKYQIVIPEGIRKEAKIKIGDFLEVKKMGNGIKLEPKSVIDRELAEALEDVKIGKTVGPFRNATHMFKVLNSHKKVNK